MQWIRGRNFTHLEDDGQEENWFNPHNRIFYLQHHLKTLFKLKIPPETIKFSWKSLMNLTAY